MRKKIWILTICGVLISSFLVSFVYFDYFDKDKKESVTASVIDDFIMPEKASFLILGVDERADDIGRSDVIVYLDINQSGVKILSIPRDTYVEITSIGFTKINHAYAYGKEYAAKKTTEKLLGKNIDYTVVFNIPQAEEIINQLGGIDVSIDDQIDYDDPYDDNGGLSIHFTPGKYHLDGNEAVKYLRFRSDDGDIGRIKRQQEVFKSLLYKFLNPSNWSTLYYLLSQSEKFMKTDASSLVLLGAAKRMISTNINSYDISLLDGYPAYINQISYWIPEKYTTIAENKRWRMAQREDLRPTIIPTSQNNSTDKIIKREENNNLSSTQDSEKNIKQYSREEVDEFEIELNENEQKRADTKKRVEEYLEKVQHYLPPGNAENIKNEKIKVK